MAVLLHHRPPPSLFVLLHFCGSGHALLTILTGRGWNWWELQEEQHMMDTVIDSKPQKQAVPITRPSAAPSLTRRWDWLGHEPFSHSGFLPSWGSEAASAIAAVQRSPRRTAAMIYRSARGEDPAPSAESNKELACWLTAETHWHFCSLKHRLTFPTTETHADHPGFHRMRSSPRTMEEKVLYPSTEDRKQSNTSGCAWSIPAEIYDACWRGDLS